VRALNVDGVLRRTSVFAAAPIIGSPLRSFEEVPSGFELRQNYPNPFNPVTAIEFSLPEDAFVTIKVYNLLGQEVATLANREEFTEGENEIEFDATALASGVYYYHINVNDGQFTQVNKMMLLK
jgi:hypothetical protein